MRLRVVFLTLLSIAVSPAARLRAETQQAQQVLEAQQIQRVRSLAALTSPEERAALHSGTDWALIVPHLPDPDTASAEQLETAADILLARRFPEDAMDYYGYAMARGGKVSELLNKIGIVRLELQQPELAREMFLRTVRVQKKDASAWNNLGVTEYQQKHYPEAIGDYKRAARLDKQSAVFHSNLGIAYSELKDMRSAQQQFTIAMRLDPRIMEPKDGFGSMAQVVGSADYGGLCFQMARMFARGHEDAQMQLWLAKASEAGFDLKEGMLEASDMRPYLKDPQVKLILINEDLRRKKTITAANVPSLGSATAQ